MVALIGCAPAANVEAEQTALLAADREWSQSTTDLEKFVSYFAADATVYSPGAPAVTGGDAIRKTIGEMMAAPGFALSWTPAEAVVAASGDIGYTSGAYEMKAAGASEKGKYVTVWKKEGDAWKVIEDIFNADTAPQSAAPQHVMLSPGALKWSDPSPSLPPGSRMAIVSGDPTQAQPFVIRAQVPAGYRVPPHWHPGVENLTVLSGTVAIGMGERFDEGTMTTIAPGGYASLPAEMRHYFLAKTASTFQVHGMGPFVINYVNPADDPAKAQK
jgi:ketosteroid isomerase-like protein/quercetin dioxygenase-like cupin family protein